MQTSSRELLKNHKKDLKRKIIEIYKKKLEKGDVEVVGADQVTKGGFLQVSKWVAKKKYLTPAAKLVWGAVLWHAWNEKDSSFPGQEEIAQECGISIKTVYNALIQLQGLNEASEVYLQVVHRGHGLSNLYRIFFKMDDEKAEYVKKQMISKISKNYRSKSVKQLKK